MGDDRLVDPLDALEAEAKDEVDREYVRAMRAYLRKHDREQAAETTDADGNALPRLDLSAASPETDDPLLRVGYALLGHLPEGWLHANLMASAAADDVRTTVMIKLEADGPLSFQYLLYLPDVAAACATLRRSMYTEDRGAWYNLAFLLRPNGAITTQVIDLHPPFGVWGPDDAALLVRDHELYPRPQERLPAWHPSR
ncbi:hypothetical protein [Jiangella alkaliphila]|uniref:Uncharacterized protein n=1 Tax=Jiangella alkaliphila TaxID=419479 RepID=A0A1H2JXB5_9ACTN|nr:hypothetical protein [Jiangella alkaliphila]SDU61099.1 hypothetical protein SAMN04488563_3188 [Jiangella alkaliphila]